MSNFLSALQAQSAALNQSRESKAVKAAQAGIVAGVPVPSISVPVEVGQDKPITATVSIVLDKNRLDVTFDRKPSPFILQCLHDGGWWYRAFDKSWYHQDNDTNRAFCNLHFDADIEMIHVSNTDVQLALPQDAGRAIEAAPIEAAPKPVQRTEADPVLPTYEEYKRMCNELAEYYNVELADLQLLCVAKIYRAVKN